MKLQNSIALHADMKEGLLAESADYASKPLRDQLKRALFRINASDIPLSIL
jgi:exocyst complex component 2